MIAEEVAVSLRKPRCLTKSPFQPDFCRGEILQEVGRDTQDGGDSRAISQWASAEFLAWRKSV